MEVRGALVGRDSERARLSEAVESARQGSGSLLPLPGGAGAGKPRLAEGAAARASTVALRGAASSSAPAPYGPVVALLRSYLRARPDGLTGVGPLLPHLAMLLPEL